VLEKVIEMKRKWFIVGDKIKKGYLVNYDYMYNIEEGIFFDNRLTKNNIFSVISPDEFREKYKNYEEILYDGKIIKEFLHFDFSNDNKKEIIKKYIEKLKKIKSEKLKKVIDVYPELVI